MCFIREGIIAIFYILCFHPENINSKSVAHVSIMGIMLTPWGCLGQAVSAAGGRSEARKGLEGRGAVLARDGTPGKPGFFAACRKKMRPNYYKNGNIFALYGCSSLMLDSFAQSSPACRLWATVSARAFHGCIGFAFCERGLTG
jgi:hypothetical protein